MACQGKGVGERGGGGGGEPLFLLWQEGMRHIAWRRRGKIQGGKGGEKPQRKGSVRKEKVEGGGKGKGKAKEKEMINKDQEKYRYRKREEGEE